MMSLIFPAMHDEKFEHITEAYDAILVPGGGLKNSFDVPLWVQRRLDLAVDFHRREPHSFIITLSAGTTHKPLPIDENGFPVFESAAGARYLEKKGVDPGKILCECCSYDTIGNAYFSLMIHVEPRSFRKLAIITSGFHINRAREIFEWVYRLKMPFSNVSRDFLLHFFGVPDDGIDENMMYARAAREKESLQNVLRLKNTIHTLDDFHRWFFTQHAAYAVFKPVERVHGAVLDMY